MTNLMVHLALYSQDVADSPIFDSTVGAEKTTIFTIELLPNFLELGVHQVMRTFI